MATKKFPRRDRKACRPSPLALEARALLAVVPQAFSIWQDDVAVAPLEPARLTVQVDRAGFKTSGGRVLLGIVASSDTSQLDPARIQASGPRRARPRILLSRPDVAGSSSSLLLASVAKGTYAFAASPELPASGDLALGAFLAGDVDGDFRVNRADVRVITSLNKARIGTARYVASADVNGDGTITKVDSKLARQNLGASTRLRPLTLSAALDPSSGPDAAGVVDRPVVAVAGVASPGALVRLIRADGGSVEGNLSADAAGRFRFEVGIDPGTTSFRIVATDRTGQRRSVPLMVTRRDRPMSDVAAPTVTLDASPSNILTTGDLLVHGRVADDLSGVRSLRARVDAGPLQDVPFDPASGRFSYTASLERDGTSDGGHSLSFVAIDAAGNASSPVIQTFQLDTQSPTVEVLSPSSGRTFRRNPAIEGRVGDAVSGVSTLFAQVDGGAATPVDFDGNGGFRFAPSLPRDGSADGAHVIRFRATDVAGNAEALATFSFTLDSTTPPDPSEVAPSLDPTSFTGMRDATSFLYTGPDAIQAGVAPGTIELRRAAVIRGKAFDRSGQTLSGVAVSVLDHPEFGSTLTRADGMFDLAVNGGGYLTVEYAKAGFLPVQRQVSVPWQDYAWADDVALSPLDSQVTTIDLASAEPIQVARGTVQTDEDGSRQATLLFPQGVGATMTLADGTTQALTTLDVRATEFTVGAMGPSAMPGQLPAASGYTYAVELSVDQALAAGATRVDFDKPVPFYLENFLAFPVGMAVPAGYYDRGRGLWVPADNGRVVAIVSEDAGLANLDVNGDGTADSATLLAGMGVTDAELAQLASLYEPGQTLWRVPIEHFTPWDCNWPFGPSLDAEGSETNPDEVQDKKEEEFSPECGSIIQVENQVLNEVIPIAGTPFSLVYSSDRVSGRTAENSLTIPLTKEILPIGLKRVELTVEVAGRQFTQSFVPSASLSTSFTWDGLDGYGRERQGVQATTVTIGYVYDGVYYEPASVARAFSATSDSLSTVNRARGEVTLNQEISTTLGRFDAGGIGLGNWTLDAQHSYDNTGRTLHEGTGVNRMSSVSDGLVIETIIGQFQQASNDYALGDSIAVSPDGTIYLSNRANHNVKTVNSNGSNLVTVAGNGVRGFGGDGGPAALASFDSPGSVAVGPDGSLYISDNGNHRIRRVGPDGIISTVAGNGVRGFGGDGGPATMASIDARGAAAVGPDGSLYIADYVNNRIRRVGPDGVISTVAGNGVRGFGGDGGPAAMASFDSPGEVTVGPDGSLYISDNGNHRIRRVGPDGVVTTVAGNGTSGFGGDGGPATMASISAFKSAAVGVDGSLYIADYTSNRIRRVGPDGFISTIAGIGQSSDPLIDGGPPTQTSIGDPVDVELGPDGTIYVASDMSRYDGSLFIGVTRITPMLPGITDKEQALPSEDGRSLYYFSSSGRHLRTVDSLTGSIIYSFTYNPNGHIASIVDGDNNVTTLERDAAGRPTAIVAPFGQRTTLAVDADGYLAGVINPATESYAMTYDPGGLLRTFTDPRQNTSSMEYDELGRLTHDEDAEHGSVTLSRQALGDGSYEITTTNAENGTRRYRVENLSDGSKRRTFIDGRGIATVTLIGTDASRSITSPDGTVATVKFGPDPRYGMLAPVPTETTIVMPSGLSSTTTTSRIATYQAPNGKIIPLATLTDTVTVNDKPFTTTYTASARTVTSTSAEGRTSSTTLDAKGRAVLVQIPGVADSTFSYDERGRLERVAQGSRAVTYAYDSRSNLQRVTDPLNRSVTFSYDLADRLVTQTQPDGSVITFRYDSGGNMVGLTPPGRPEHTFSFDKDERLDSATAPDVGPGSDTTRYVYNLADQLVKETLPSGTEILYAYCECGRLTGIDTPWGEYTYTYSTATGELESLASPGGFTLAFGYDGALITSTTLSGPVSGRIDWTYDADFRLNTESVNGGNTVGYGYDTDGLLTQAGDLAIARDALNGRITGTTLGTVTDMLSYNAFGELGQYEALIGSAVGVQTTFTRDDLGRITRKVETIGGVATTTDYGYDLRGQLETVKENGDLVQTYAYDENGNRLSLTTPTGTVNGDYDDQDRLTTYGTKTYTYTVDGYFERVHDAANGETTHYTYDVFGNLTRVELPDGRVIEYMLDGQYRRVGKRIDGVFVEGLIYRGQLQPVAKVDADGNIVARFVYGTGANVPEYMVKGGITYRFITDQLGSVRLIINATTGDIVQRLEYDAFGSVLLDTNQGFQPFGFAGGLFDSDTNLVRFGARDYESSVGRWTAKDPIGFNAGVANLYGYVNADPVNRSDSSGLLSVEAQRVVDAALESTNGNYARAVNIIKSMRDELYKTQQIQNSALIEADHYLTAAALSPLPGMMAPVACGYEACKFLTSLIGQNCKGFNRKGEAPESPPSWEALLAGIEGSFVSMNIFDDNPGAPFGMDF